MKRENPSILYWKWDDSHLNGSFKDGIEDICRRSVFSHIYITTHWCNTGITSPIVHEAIKESAGLLHEKGRKIIFEIDGRAEKKVYLKQFGNRIGFVYTREILLDHQGMGSVYFSIRKEDQNELFFSSNHYSAEILDARCYTKKGDEIDESSVCNIQATCERVNRNEIVATIADKKHANRYAYLALCSYINFPDFCAPSFRSFFQELIEQYRDIPLDGIALDEFSLPEHPDFNFTFRTYNDWNNSRLYGKEWESSYKETYGADYLDDIFDSFYLPPNDRRRIVAVNRYFEFIRKTVTGYENDMYALTKKYYGEDAFVGVHPTWYAIEEVDNTPEVWKNGIDWWDVKRDYGFTDEIMLYPVRTALTHKAGANIFYNMWYGECTQDYKTFFPEMWRNVRYGGRTISLSYECINEKHIVNQLKEPGVLEQISDIEREIRLVDEVQCAPVNCDILIVTGIEAACSILANLVAGKIWDTERGNFKESFILARDIFNLGYNCDLVGNYEIYNQNVSIGGDGYVRYGNQSYKFVILHALQFSKKEIETFVHSLSQSKTGFVVMGEADKTFDGGELTVPCDFVTRPQARDLTVLFEKYHAEKNTLPNGCVLQDGSMIFTAPVPDKAVGNVFETTFSYGGKSYSFTAEDFLYLKWERGAFTKVSPKLIAWKEN